MSFQCFQPPKGFPSDQRPRSARPRILAGHRALDAGDPRGEGGDSDPTAIRAVGPVHEAFGEQASSF